MERVTHSRPGDREADRECFRLSKAGRDLCREELSCRLYNAQNPAHDLCLSDRYHAISPEERATWKTESECRDIFTEHIQQLPSKDFQGIRQFMANISRSGMDCAVRQAGSRYLANKYMNTLTNLGICPIPIPQNARTPFLENPFREFYKGGCV